jgi:3,4-dihydroxy 2-butanone 4-phosphate synthase/GTP cyclohydrolase II
MKTRPPKHAAPAARSTVSAQHPLRIVAVAELPTRFGDFRVVAFTPDAQGDEHVAIVRGAVRGLRDVPTRIHSECVTGDVLGSLRCDCRDQLTTALEQLGSLRAGALFYLRQEGRGIGLENKLKAYQLQDKGYDTVTANLKLGFAADLRDYGIGAQILADLGVRQIELLTNNPRKVVGLEAYGLTIVKRVPVQVKPNVHNRRYLSTKRDKLGHLLELARGEDE